MGQPGLLDEPLEKLLRPHGLTGQAVSRATRYGRIPRLIVESFLSSQIGVFLGNRVKAGISPGPLEVVNVLVTLYWVTNHHGCLVVFALRHPHLAAELPGAKGAVGHPGNEDPAEIPAGFPKGIVSGFRILCRLGGWRGYCR